MAALTHFVKTDATQRDLVNPTSATELTDYTILWADLAAAGFVDGDEVVLVVGVKTWNNSANGNTFFAVGFGTTFAGRVEDATSVQRAEPVTAGVGDQYLWIKKRTLVINNNIYFRGQVAANSIASYNELVCLTLHYADIGTNDKLYAEASHSGDAPTTYTSGASANTPAAGDWWFAMTGRFLVDGIDEDMFVAIHDGTTDIAEIVSQSEDAADERVIGTMAYKAGLGSGATIAARYKEAGATAPPDIASTALFGLRLNAFQDHAGAHTTNTVTHSVIDTLQEFAGFGSYGLTTTGPFVVIGWPIHTLSSTDIKRPYGRIQIAGADWPATNANRIPVSTNGVAGAKCAPLLFGYSASQTASTLDIDLDCAEDTDISPTYACDVQVAVAFSLMLPPASLLRAPVSPSMMSMLVR